jgi:hypothetical protein
MAIIPGGQQIRTNSADANLKNRGNALTKKMNQVYTMDDIVETVNQEGSTLPYKSLFLKLTQSGSSDPTYQTISNQTDITFSGVIYGTGVTGLIMSSGTYPSQGKIMVVTGGFKSNRTSHPVMQGFHDGQQIKIITGYYNFSGVTEAKFVKDHFGYGGTESIIVEIRVFE